MTAAGLIFSNIHDSALPELTRMRTIASVPFGCKYRLIDFPLSNMVNSGINKIGIVTHYNYQSLLDHIGTGKDWDLARRSGGIKILPPFITAYDNASANKLYSTRLEALFGVMNFISRCTEDFIVMSDCDVISNIDVADVINTHVSRGSDITVVTKKILPTTYPLSVQNDVVTADADGNIMDVAEYTKTDSEIELSINVIVIAKPLLHNLLLDAIAHGYNSFYRDIIGRNIGKLKLHTYRYEGYFSLVASLESYFHASMKLLRSEAREGLFAISNRPIYTKVRNMPPAKYIEGANVSNSMIADGCVIEGKVENSILFRGVKVGKGTVVKNCILMQDTYVGNDVALNCVISDKNVIIKDGRALSGHESMPFFIGKGIMV